MPQLDPSTFATQLVWLIITFLILYLILWKSALPRIASILQDRQERIDNDLEKAEKLKKEALKNKRENQERLREILTELN